MFEHNVSTGIEDATGVGVAVGLGEGGVGVSPVPVLDCETPDPLSIAWKLNFELQPT